MMAPANVVAKHVILKGLVQGVFFRAFTRDLAQSLDIKGFVKNLPDGTVEVWAEGIPAQMQRFLEGLKNGPPGARVDDMTIEDEEPRGLNGPFEIRY